MIEYEAEDEELRVMDWELGLPTAEDLPPLSQPLIPPSLASAFSITPEPCPTMSDVNRASQDTLSGLRRHGQATSGTSRNSVVVEEDEADLACDGSESRKQRRIDSGVEEAESSSSLPTENAGDDSCGKALKRQRLVWTPQLHKRFVEVVTHLGIKTAVPKTIMQMMNVEGLTRENVASHLQKYRLYLKRMQGLSDEGPSSSDHQSLPESGRLVQMQIPMLYPPPLPLPLIGHSPSPYQGGFESYPYNMMAHKDWLLGKFDLSSLHHLSSNKK